MPRFAQLMVICFALPLIVMTEFGAAQSRPDDSRAMGAGDAAGGSLYETLKAMQEEMAKLRQDNQAMKDQIDELRARTDDNWLTEARAAEIRNLVQDVLADSDTRANMLDDGIMAGWSEHFFLADAFGRFMLQVDGMVQFRYVLSYRDQNDDVRDGFEVTRTRLTFRGHVFNEDLQYLVRAEASPYPPQGIAQGAFGLLDSWLRYTFTNEWSVRAGQFKLPFMREEMVSESERLAVEQSLMNLNTSVGRSQGVELAYHDSANAWSIALSDGMSARPNTALAIIMGASGIPGGTQVPGMNTGALAQNVEFALTTRYERLLAGTWGQFNDFTSPIDDEFGMLLGLGLHWQQNETTRTPFVASATSNESVGVTLDYSVEWGGANAFIAASYHYLDSRAPSASGIGIGHILGVVGHVGVYLSPKWEVFARGEWVQLETSGSGTVQVPDMGIVTLGFNYYIEGHDVKWTTDVGFSTTELSAVWTSELTGWRPINHGVEPEVTVRSQIQILF